MTQQLEKIDVFEARTEGYFHFRIPALVVTGSGTVLAFAEGRRGKGGDWDLNDIVLKRSFDNGTTWEPMRLIVGCDRYGATISNWTVIADRKRNRVHATYCVDYKRCFYLYSDDDGVTFSEPADITAAFEPLRSEYDWKVIATGPGHGLQMKSGRLVIPVWLSLSLDSTRHRPSVVSVIYSDDGGRSWKAGGLIPDTIENLSEAALAELDDGSVYINMRNESNTYRRAYSISPDGATGWSVPRFDEQLEEPVCFGSLLRLTESGVSGKSRIVFVNPANLDVEFRWGNNKMRKDLTIKMSYDDGRTWPVRKLLEEGDAEYSDLAAASDGLILCLYSRAFLTGGADPRWMTLARFNLEWLTGGADRG